MNPKTSQMVCVKKRDWPDGNEKYALGSREGAKLAET